MAEKGPYRDDLESQYRNTLNKLSLAQNELEHTRGMLRKMSERIFTKSGIILLVFVAIVSLFGGLGTYLICVASQVSVLGAIGGSCITLASIVSITGIIVAVGADEFFN